MRMSEPSYITGGIVPMPVRSIELGGKEKGEVQSFR